MATLRKYKGEKKKGYVYFKIHEENFNLFQEYKRFIRKKLATNKKVNISTFDKLMDLLERADEEKEHYHRIVQEATISTVRHFKNDKFYYFNFKKERLTFDDMIQESIAVLVLKNKLGELDDTNRDECIRELTGYILEFIDYYEIPWERKQYKAQVISGYIVIKLGFTLILKQKYTHDDIFQMTRNAFKPKKLKKKS